MCRTLVVLLFLMVGTAGAADPPTVADLVRQLGDDKFTVREPT